MEAQKSEEETTLSILKENSKSEITEEKKPQIQEESKELDIAVEGWGLLVALNKKHKDVLLREQEIVIGRKRKLCHPDAVFPENLKISNVHCKILLENINGFWSAFLEDKSANGTYVNKQLVGKSNRIALKNGDDICLVYPSLTHKKADIDTISYRFIDNFAKWKQPASPKESEEKTDETEIPQQLPEYFIMMLRASPLPHTLEALHLALKQHGSTWIGDFMELGGVSLLLEILSLRHKKARRTAIDEAVEVDALRCLTEVMNHKIGLDHVLSLKFGLGELTLLIDSKNTPLRRKIPKLLACVAVIDDVGHSKVLEAFDYYALVNKERVRFQNLVKYLTTDNDVPFLTQSLTLVNAIVNYPDAIETRLHLREEFLELGILVVLDNLKLAQNPNLSTQIHVFFEEFDEDNKQNMIKNLHLLEPDQIIQFLRKKSSEPSYQNFLSILQQFLLIPDSELGSKIWKSLEQMVHKVVLLQEGDNFDEGVRMAIPDLKQLIVQKKEVEDQLRRLKDLEETMTNKDGHTFEMVVQSKEKQLLEKFEEEKSALVSALENEKVKMEQEFAQKLQDIEAQYQVIVQYRAQKGETLIFSNLKKSIEEAQSSLKRSKKNVEGADNAEKPGEEPQKEEVVAETPPAPENGDAPPPPPPPGAPPPPPPGGVSGKAEEVKEPKLKPQIKMKQLFWKKVQSRELESTIWSKVNFEEAKFDVKELENLFSAEEKEKKEGEAEHPEKQLIRKISIVDSSRARNMGIFLAFTKLTMNEIKAALMKMDERVLTLEKIRELVKLCPTSDEQKQFAKYNGPIEELTDMDRAFMNLLSVPNLKNRLEVFDFKLNFKSLLEEYKKDIYHVTAASKAVLGSSRFVSLLELILAIGNYCNYKPKKAAVKGFKLEFLSKLENTRSIDGKTTLLHFIARYVETSDLVHIFDDLKSIEDARRISSKDLAKNVQNLKDKLAFCQLQASLPSEKAQDLLPEVISAFCEKANLELEVLERLLSTMKSSLQQCIDYFAEADVTSSEEIFATLNDFLLSLKHAIRENERERQSEEKKKRIDERRKRRKELEPWEDELKKMIHAESSIREKLLKTPFQTLRGGSLFSTKRKARHSRPLLKELAYLQSSKAELTPEQHQAQTAI